MVKKPKAKGNKFENEVLMQCKEIDPMSHKTLGSGNSDKDKGDIAFLSFLIECKHRKDFTDGMLLGFFDKVKKEAKEKKKIPLLVYKRNNRIPMVMFEDIVDGERKLFMYWKEFLEGFA